MKVGGVPATDCHKRTVPATTFVQEHTEPCLGAGIFYKLLDIIKNEPGTVHEVGAF
jgi:hypothetical protein